MSKLECLLSVVADSVICLAIGIAALCLADRFGLDRIVLFSAGMVAGSISIRVRLPKRKSGEVTA